MCPKILNIGRVAWISSKRSLEGLALVFVRGPCQTSMMELFLRNWLTTKSRSPFSQKSSIVDV